MTRRRYRFAGKSEVLVPGMGWVQPGQIAVISSEHILKAYDWEPVDAAADIQPPEVPRVPDAPMEEDDDEEDEEEPLGSREE